MRTSGSAVWSWPMSRVGALFTTTHPIAPPFVPRGPGIGLFAGSLSPRPIPWSLRMSAVMVLSLIAALQGPQCTPVPGNVPAATWLSRARNAVGMSHGANRVLQFHAVQGENQDYESDRSYPP